MSPLSPETGCAEAYRLYHAGEAAGAEALCRRVLRDAPGHADAAYLLGVIEQEAGRWDEALGWFQAAARHAPANGLFHNGEGEAWLALDRPEEALASFQR